MRIIVHDYAGHPFQVQLSRALAARGHDILHAYCSSLQTPQGTMKRHPDDPVGFATRALDLGNVIPKTRFFSRLKLETKYARLLIDTCREFHPDVVLSGNTPSIPQQRLAVHCHRHGIRHVFWVQDIYGLAAYKLLSRKLPIIGHAAGKYFMRLDRQSAQLSDSIVIITKDFRPTLEQWGIDPGRIHVIHNWSVLEELPLRPRENVWSDKHRLGDGPRFLYSGTLAMKHNPALLLELARTLDREKYGELLVISEGAGVEWLAAQADREQIGSLRCLGFQPFEVLPEVLGAADVLVAILEPDAGVFSVPSKVLSYLCAGRPVLLAVPTENLAARIVVECGAGLVVEPTDMDGFCRAAQQLVESPELRAGCGASARSYAEAHFDINRITDRFASILGGAEQGGSG
jgi:glycosyltransferase involved in cell wall biosynthesis